MCLQEKEVASKFNVPFNRNSVTAVERLLWNSRFNYAIGFMCTNKAAGFTSAVDGG